MIVKRHRTHHRPLQLPPVSKAAAVPMTLPIPTYAAGAVCLTTTGTHQIGIDARTLFPELIGGKGTLLSFNPSIVVWKGDIWASVRVFSEHYQRSEILLGKIDSDWKMPNPHMVRNRIGDACPHGLEDMRIWTTADGRLWGSATVVDRVGRKWPSMVTVLFNDDRDIIGSHVMLTERYEKNWMPFSDGRGWIYSIHGGRGYIRKSVFSVYDEMSPLPYPDFQNRHQLALRGGSQVISYKDGYLAIVHERAPDWTPPMHYVHRFVYFDADLAILSISQPWFVRHRGIEFVAGLAEWKGEFVLSAGINDSESVIASVSTKTVEDMLASNVGEN
jgi:hypothetical protein